MSHSEHLKALLCVSQWKFTVESEINSNAFSDVANADGDESFVTRESMTQNFLHTEAIRNTIVAFAAWVLD